MALIKVNRRRNKPNVRGRQPRNPQRPETVPVPDLPYYRTHSHRIEEIANMHGVYIMPAHGWNPPGWAQRVKNANTHPDLRRKHSKSGAGAGHTVRGYGDSARTNRFEYAPKLEDQ